MHVRWWTRRTDGEASEPGAAAVVVAGSTLRRNTITCRAPPVMNESEEVRCGKQSESLSTFDIDGKNEIVLETRSIRWPMEM